jgi:hypothetical protein
MNYSQDLFWNNIPYTKNRVFKKMGFLSSCLERFTFLKNIKNPYYIWTGTGRILKLENKILNSKTKNKLQKKEVFFYLYEPLCARVEDQHNRSFYSEFNSNDAIDKIISDEFESIIIFVKNNNIKNFRIFTSDYNIQLIQKKYPSLKVACLDTFLREAACFYQGMDDLENKITKKFWCGNWRYTTHRHLVTSYMSKLDGTYTWNLKCSYQELQKNNWFSLNKLQDEYLDQYNQLIDGVAYLYDNVLAIDQNIDAVEVNKSDEVFIPGHNSPKWSQSFLQSYRNSFCAVVNETRYAQPFGYFSEKTLTAIWSKLPFILVAPPHTLEYLKTFGFKTFDKWWDESYDKEENHYNRMIKIFNLIDYINSKSINDLQQIYIEMLDHITHNATILKTIPLNDKIL